MDLKKCGDTRQERLRQVTRMLADLSRSSLDANPSVHVMIEGVALVKRLLESLEPDLGHMCPHMPLVSQPPERFEVVNVQTVRIDGDCALRTCTAMSEEYRGGEAIITVAVRRPNPNPRKRD